MDSSLPPSAPANRTLLTLLGGIFALLSVLVLALVVGGVYAFHEYRVLRTTVLAGPEARQAGSARQTVHDVGQDLLSRQEALATQLRGGAAEADAKLQGFQHRIDGLYTPRKGFQKLGQAIALMQLMCDQMMLMNHQMASLQATMARAVRPLSTEREWVQGVGGSGSEGREGPKPVPAPVSRAAGSR